MKSQSKTVLQLSAMNSFRAVHNTFPYLEKKKGKKGGKRVEKFLWETKPR